MGFLSTRLRPTASAIARGTARNFWPFLVKTSAMRLALLPLVGFLVLSACSKQAEGERCSTDNGDDDCESGLSCVSSTVLKSSSDLCCPASGATDPGCVPGQDTGAGGGGAADPAGGGLPAGGSGGGMGGDGSSAGGSTGGQSAAGGSAGGGSNPGTAGGGAGGTSSVGGSGGA